MPGMRACHDDAVVTALPNRAQAALRAAAFTYPDVGATAGPLPPHYRHFTRSRPLVGRDLPEAAEQLLAWRAHERAGLRVAASSPVATPGAVVLMRLGIGPAALRIPCRVVYVVHEPDRAGFAYGTLPGHPERGEELFLLERDERGLLTFTVTAFSQPATLLTRLGGPISRWAQDHMTDRYLRALDQP